MPNELNYFLVKPEEGYVAKFKKVKTRSGDDVEYQKCFVNICFSKEMHKPPIPVTQETYTKEVKIPVELSGMQYAQDNKGENSLKFDALVHTSVFNKSTLNGKPGGPICDAIIQAICDKLRVKHNIEMDATEAIFLTKKKSMGEIDAMKVYSMDRMVEEVEGTNIREDGEQTRVQESLRHLHVSIENMRIRVLDGEKMEISMKIDCTNAIPKLSCRCSSDRLVVLADGARSLFDSHLPMKIDKRKVITRFAPEKALLLILAPLHIPLTNLH